MVNHTDTATAHEAAAHRRGKITERNQQQSPLLRLPPELRDMVYAYAFDTAQIDAVSIDLTDPCSKWRPRVIETGGPLLLACSQTFNEVTRFKKTYLHIRCHDMGWYCIPWLPDAKLNAIRSITFEGHIRSQCIYIAALGSKHARGPWGMFLMRAEHSRQRGSKPAVYFPSLQIIYIDGITENASPTELVREIRKKDISIQIRFTQECEDESARIIRAQKDMVRDLFEESKATLAMREGKAIARRHLAQRRSRQ
ncbi:uncharacterized protein M421DRAFT_420418 [Didymella exigua CBS 183.55]|uniref:F-box domain-containing protein n=1 Tax=Didymella exigua CBS 183.55 TaxID=1150837 RepID=A0A6A5RN34_9PLEO|nr:uncharacterized protein M421DRAFT_420418 [Didymella exigua CBS 183.55]KAF1928538.1 hypothetical protein M421DRAFT_420418 [Didymella exigua CBS 183.55]